ncbi:tRNA-guanine transglycosylase, partial [Candidatus Daviesbacteria bacterium]|nr:tRNA-guanine transglycosylase [Candidatus Daviesbacteria bacterium]
ESLELTKRWALRSLKGLKRLGSKQLMYGVVHGGRFEDLRISSARFTDKHFDAIAIGGIYEDRNTMNKIIDWTVDNVSDEKVRHMLGVSEIENLLDAVERGMDLFDCVAPTRRARHGFLYPDINIRSSKYKTDKKPIDPKCHCYTCQNYSRSYLRHLYVAEELLYHSLSTYHNVYFIINLMKMIRSAIIEGKLSKLRQSLRVPRGG